MKLKFTMNKLPLITLLALGLVSSPLVVNASNNDRGRDGHHQQDRVRHHQKIEHHRDYRDYNRHQKHTYQNSHRNDYRHGGKRARHYDRSYGHYGHYNKIQRSYSNGHHYDRPFYFLSLFSG